MKTKVKVNYRWTTNGSCGGYRWFASGVCNGKKFKAERVWSCNAYSSWKVLRKDGWTGIDDRFDMNERRAIGKAIGKK